VGAGGVTAPSGEADEWPRFIGDDAAGRRLSVARR